MDKQWYILYLLNIKWNISGNLCFNFDGYDSYSYSGIFKYFEMWIFFGGGGGAGH